MKIMFYCLDTKIMLKKLIVGGQSCERKKEKWQTSKNWGKDRIRGNIINQITNVYKELKENKLLTMIIHVVVYFFYSTCNFQLV